MNGEALQTDATTEHSETEESLAIRVSGLVQGVGYRPWVWQIATALQLRGEVWNDSEGVQIRVSGSTRVLDEFIEILQKQSPPLARVDDVCISHEQLEPLSDTFKISASRHGVRRTGILPDAATCSACLNEIGNSTEHRYGYAFTNCTHCGPRFSIQKSIPWDRSGTTMAEFPLCPRCDAEYRDPQNRRFHAQPLACPDCGPRLWLEGDFPGLPKDDPIQRCAQALSHGAIVAIKGIGGFHLACDARDIAAITRLRERKQRPHKPFALMARDLTSILQYCEVSEAASAALESPAAPVVLLPRLRYCPLPEDIAPGQRQLGFMLAHTPLHHLLLKHCQAPLVMTSGNRSGDPQVHDNDVAMSVLFPFCDGWVLHNRPIHNRIDDSVMKGIGEKIQVLRRARGLAPSSFSLPPGFQEAPPLLAVGGQLKNTFCLIDQGQAVVSQHVGDLESPALRDDYQLQVERYQTLFEHQAQWLACDLHDDYYSSRYAQERSEAEHLPLVQVAHHHAHMAACLAENAIPLDTAPVLGLVLDGLGLGEENKLLGGELFLGNYQQVKRLGGLLPVLLPGAEAAQVQPWRNVWAQLRSFSSGRNLLLNSDLEGIQRLADKPLGTLEQMAERRINSPLCSSAGRLLDAIAWWLNLCPDELSYEGQAAINLESRASQASLDENDRGYSFFQSHVGGLVVISPAPMWTALMTDQACGESTAVCAARFFRGFARALVTMCKTAAESHAVTQVALSGGVMQNDVLVRELLSQSRNCGLQFLLHRNFPPNDAGLSLGQACVAAARILNQHEEQH